MRRLSYLSYHNAGSPSGWQYEVLEHDEIPIWECKCALCRATVQHLGDLWDRALRGSRPPSECSCALCGRLKMLVTAGFLQWFDYDDALMATATFPYLEYQFLVSTFQPFMGSYFKDEYAQFIAPGDINNVRRRPDNAAMDLNHLAGYVDDTIFISATCYALLGDPVEYPGGFLSSLRLNRVHGPVNFPVVERDRFVLGFCKLGKRSFPILYDNRLLIMENSQKKNLAARAAGDAAQQLAHQLTTAIDAVDPAGNAVGNLLEAAEQVHSLLPEPATPAESLLTELTPRSNPDPIVVQAVPEIPETVGPERIPIDPNDKSTWPMMPDIKFQPTVPGTVKVPPTTEVLLSSEVHTAHGDGKWTVHRETKLGFISQLKLGYAYVPYLKEIAPVVDDPTLRILHKRKLEEDEMDRARIQTEQEL